MIARFRVGAHLGMTPKKYQSGEIDVTGRISKMGDKGVRAALYEAAQLMRLGWFRPVHCKSVPAQETRALLTARKLVQGKLYDIEMSLRGILRGFGLKVGRTTKAGFASRIRELTEHHPALKACRA